MSHDPDVMSGRTSGYKRGGSRCEAINPETEGQCVFTPGHGGTHIRGLERWSDTPEPTKQRPGDQVLPRPGVVCVQDLVIQRMEESKKVGVERYGTVLETFNGRKGIQDVAEEVRDLFVYLTQVEEESKADRGVLVDVVSNAIRTADGDHTLGAGALAEVAVDAVMNWVVGQKMVS